MAVEHVREFDRDLASRLEDSLRNEYAVEVKVEPTMVLKTNGEMRALQIKVEGQNVSPTIYTTGAFEQYQDGVPMESIAHEMCESVSRAMRDTPELPELTPEEARKHITLTLVNTAMNEELLSRTPHFEILGGELSAIPRWYIDEGASFIVSNDLCQSLALTPDEILQIGQEHINAQQFEAKSMQQVMAEMMGADFMDMMSMDEGPQMIVLTSENKIQGANALLSEEALEQVRELLDGDYAILPSSIHETLCLPITEDLNPDMLRTMVQEVNTTQVAPDERLSNEVFMYHDHRLTIVGDNFEMDDQEIEAPRMESQRIRFAM